MADWKLLGEVPDSEDDDGFDSQVSTTAQETTAAPAPPQPETNASDIWAFPDSQDEACGPRIAYSQKPPLSSEGSLNSSPLSSARSLDGLPDLDDILLDDNDADNANDTQKTSSNQLSTQNNRQIYIELPNGTPSISLDPPYDAIDDTVPSSPVNTASHGLSSQDLGMIETNRDLQREAIRLERSLRPRKPIQEHPYQLESAHHNNLFRRHGMRPVRAPVVHARASRDENAQDTEFQDDSQGNSLPELNNSSQIVQDIAVEERGDYDMFNFPSSSPPKTSPWVTNGKFSNHDSSQGDTDNTSMPDQDLPSLNELFETHHRKLSPSTKRSSLTLESSTRKRRRHDIIDSDPVDSDVGGKDPPARPSAASVSMPGGSLPPIPRLQLNARRAMNTPPIKTILTISNSSSEEDEGSSKEESSQTQVGASDDPTNEKSDFVSRVGRRIKGVLPASWLRLDQKTSRDKLQKSLHSRQQRPRTPEKELRRGVAQIKTRNTAPSSTVSALLYDSSDDETLPRYIAPAEVYREQSRLVLIPDDTPVIPVEDPLAIPVDTSSSDESVMEHDTIDTMFQGQAQRRAPGEAARRSKTGVDYAKRTNSKLRQQKITTSLTRNKSASGVLTKQRPIHEQNTVQKKTSNRRRAAAKPTPPPLSVLDVIEPHAPRFMRIAARTARTRVNQGRSSPSKKSICLASSRRDYVDAISSLNDWKNGSIQQRKEISIARREKRKERPRNPLAESAVNKPVVRTTPKQLKPVVNKSRKLVKQKSNGGTTCYLPSNNITDTSPSANVVAEDYNGSSINKQPSRSRDSAEGVSAESLCPSRPALLEAEDLTKGVLLAFHKRKKFLDSVYRRSNRASSVNSGDSRSEFSIDRLSTRNVTRIRNDDTVADSPVEKQPKSRDRRRKAANPRRIDVEAPQFSHAADPLPASYEVEVEAEQSQNENLKARLGGLGPYGTKYTTHFEVFPLDPGVYFHQSTLLGSNIIEDCHNVSKMPVLLSSRPRSTLQFGSFTYRWSEWNSQSSSELGIVLDLITEELEKPEGICTSGEATVIEASQFISKYATSSLSFANQEGVKSFITRALSVAGGCHNRVTSLVSKRTLSQRTLHTAVKVYDHLMILAFVSLLICNNDDSLMVEKFKVEDLLRQLSAGSVSLLLLIGTNKLKEVYMQLQVAEARERGIREDQPVIHSWTLLMHILQQSHIPKGSFWDVLKQVIATDDQTSSADAQVFERIWEIMFTLLPISEFSLSGVLVRGKRHDTTSDGWSIVRLLLQRVFDLYRGNTRQAASFTDYCRAVISRCHYLVQQWGWRRSGSIIGTIFDFFGSQNLEHLRNEEVNTSPKFLEDLAGEPSLAVEPEDNCFHIFLKLLALSIRNHRAANAMNDIRNLVSRTTPNHNRQHLKEQAVHERELAALRNHHDLLATLFWAAPADLRPKVELVERLVVPETSHKEATLINIRCWNQLARFIAAKGETKTAFRAFHAWRKRFFDEMAQQLKSAAADIQQQLRELPNEVRLTISDDMVQSMISMNKGAASDVLHACIAASFDVLKHAADLEAATFWLNTSQLKYIYDQFGIYPPELNWNTLIIAIATLDVFQSRIADFKETEESQPSDSQILNSGQADDALLSLDNDRISRSYFAMVRCTLSNSPSRYGRSSGSEIFDGIENLVVVAVKLAASFLSGGLIRLPDLFKHGHNYNLFYGPIQKMRLEQRQYLILAVVTLLQSDIDDFAELNFSLCELWLLLLVTPSRYIAYENELAESLRKRGEYFVPATDTGLTHFQSYESNSVLFEFSISAMRRSVRDAGPNLKKILTAEHSKALKLVMEQLKEDLKETSGQPVTHVPYVAYARQIIALIRTYGSEFCTVDNFFYQISKDYSPSTEDPQLQAAAMVSYGLRLSEGDPKVVQQIFYFLFNSFKMAVISDSLLEEKKMLQKGIADDRGILGFILGKMLPAIIGAASAKAVAFPLLDLYARALRYRFRGHVMTYSLADDDLVSVKVVLQAILAGLQGWVAEQAAVTSVKLCICGNFFAVANLLWPSIYAHSLEENNLTGPWGDIVALINTLGQYAAAAKDTIGIADFRSSQIRFDEIFATSSLQDFHTTSVTDADVTRFADNLKQDIDRNWIEVDGRISIQTPGKPRGGGTVHGVLQAVWNVSEIIEGMTDQLMEWRDWEKKMNREHMMHGQGAELPWF
ncbi:hypothetical protein NQ176_g109 [Zarea fungicola]|uniref:Uncharacterized protein n=1 Tax=Zarea fungicola TaxID=93591 RepID=A0ACC1P134_9HYPO|nr:hypothetical protein NQ176_g109 [Lecanicillium fungicola]